ncbi:MAG TPA: alpha/beta fold hydrolase [Candidatus Dormibacteraeota bacterium]|nr:alpha/beta fold hydrolase [Candidatus Dormibacteraeota bacterium]
MGQGELARPDGTVLRWDEAGAGDPVVCLHGLSSTARSFHHQLRGLARDFRVVALDHRGYGRSDDGPTAPTLEDWAADAAAVIEVVGPPVHLVGSSFGALVGAAVARRRPELLRSFTLASPTLGRGGLSAAEREAWRSARLATINEDPAARAAKMAGREASPQALEVIEESVRRVRPDNYRAVVEAIAEADAVPWLRELHLPVLVIAGAEDRITGPPVATRAAAEVPGARLVLIPGAGHAVHLERPILFNSALSAFLLEVGGVKPLRVGVCGAGAVGRQVIEGVALGMAGPARVVAVAHRPGGETRLFDLAAHAGIALTDDPSRLPQLGAEVVVEAAGAEVARSNLVAWTAAGSDVLLLSVAALADPEFEAELRRRLRRSRGRVLVPAGAIGGLDALGAAALAGLDEVSLTTVKPQHALDGRVDGSSEVLFAGSARAAAAAFPRNMNVAATVALAAAGCGVEPMAELIADPVASHNRHRLVARGTFGRIETLTENLPSPDNPRTSYLTGLSALAALRRLREPILVGA